MIRDKQAKDRNIIYDYINGGGILNTENVIEKSPKKSEGFVGSDGISAPVLLKTIISYVT